MRYVIICLLLFMFCAPASAQKTKATFVTAIQGGLLEGEAGSAFQLHAVNSLQYKTWSVGLGAGLDYYGTRSIPLYGAFRKALRSSEKSAFVYLNAGYHFPWLRTEDKGWGETNANGGLYYEAGVGYQLPVLKTSSLFFSLGFSQKDFNIRHTDGAVIAIWPAPPVRSRLMEYNLRRLSIGTGLRF